MINKCVKWFSDVVASEDRTSPRHFAEICGEDVVVLDWANMDMYSKVESPSKS
jgi:hypothetical protein